MAMKKRAVPQKQTSGDDSIIYKIMIALGMLCILLLALNLVSRNYRLAGPMLTIRTGLGWAAVLGGILAVAFLAGWLTQRKASAFWRHGGLPLFLLCLVVALSSWLLYATWVSYVGVLYFLYIAAAVLYMISLLYQREFLLLSAVNACAGIVFFGLSHQYGTSAVLSPLAILLNLLLLVVSLGAALLVWWVRKHHQGILKLFGRSVHLSPPDGSPLLLYVSCLVWIVCLVAAALLGSVFAYYCVYACVAFELIAAVYYTVKLS